MESTAADGSCDNLSSPPARLAPGKRFSASGSHFIASSDIHSSPQSISLDVTQPSTSSPQNYSSTAYLSPPTAQSSYLPAPASQPYSSSYPVLSPAVLNSTWSHAGHIPDSTPSFRFQVVEGTSNTLPPRLSHSESTSSMSAVALQFDPSFNMGSRSNYTWPGPLESSNAENGMLGHDLSTMPPGSEPSLTPPTGARSLTSSPPRSTLTTEQRELKRQQDKARRDSRLVTRMRRTSSQSYVDSPPPTMTMPDATGAMTLPVYTTAPAPMSLLTEPASTTMGGQPYLPAAYNAPMDDQQAHAAHVYQNAYPQHLQPGYSMSMEYPPVYAGPSQYSTRPTTSVPVGQDVGLMYQVPAVMTSGGAGSQEGGHVRVVQSRPKPRCWEHGCNGRQFSTFSNLLRHQREKSGQAAKATCPNCGAEFTRTTARNGHLLHDKCKGRRNA